MRLVSLEIQGFKSFADPVKIYFDKGVTAIVGPNGCGKSNIVDAIRWVLGEQRTSILRSDKMSNLIFNGSKERKPSSLAEVSITFENDQQEQFSNSYSQFTITRKLYRSGESEYLLNHIPCRLKDIKDLLARSEIQSVDYAIIELSMINEILSGQPSYRTALFEEAAGISFFKTRKKEALQRLEETEQNLNRLLDLLDEIEKNLKQLQKQAKRAQRYLQITAEYKKVSAIYFLLKWKDLSQKQLHWHEKAGHVEKALQQTLIRLSKHEEAIQQLRTQQNTLEQQYQEIQSRHQKILEQINKAENEIALKKQRITFLQQQIEKNQERIQRYASTEANLLQQKEQAENQLHEYENQFTQIQSQFNQQQEQLQTLQEAFSLLQKQDKELQNKVRALEQEILSKKHILKNLQDQKQRNLTRLTSLEKDLQKREQFNQATYNQIQALEQQLQQKKELLIEKQTFVSNQTNKLKEIRDKLENIQDKIRYLDKEISNVQKEQDLYKDIVENLEGYPESIRFLKKNQLNQVLIVGEIFDCEEQYRRALEAYLEPYLNYFVIDSLHTAQEAIRLLQQSEKGKAHFFLLPHLPQPPEPIEPYHEEHIPFLPLLSYDSIYQPLAFLLFTNVFLSPHLPEQPLPPSYHLVHPEGLWVLRGYQITGGSLSLFEGKRTGHRQHLKKLQDQLRQLQSQLHELHKQKQQLEKQRVEISQLIQQNNPSKLEKEIHDLEKQLSSLQSRIEITTTESQNVQTSITELLQENQNLEKQIFSIQQEIEELNARLQDLQKNAAQHHSQLLEKQKQLQQQQQANQQLFFQMQRLQNQIQNTTEKIENITKQIEKEKRELEQSQKEIQRYEEEIIQLRQEIKLIQDQLLMLFKEKEKNQIQLTEIKNQVEEIKQRIGNNEKFAQKERELKEQQKEELSRIQREMDAIEIEKNSLLERAKMTFQDKDFQSLSLDDPSAWEVQPDELSQWSLKKAEEKQRQLWSQWENFGPVNTEAIQDYQLLKERYDFMIQQRNDLIQAKENLLQTISEIEQAAKEAFLSAFFTIRQHFQTVFKKLFTEDDECDLILINEQDPLHSSIQIVAKPKEKRPLTIDQLSGGEKTLTVIALLFAIYLHKPSPFCIFDEVDAVLDDMNIDKFNNLIKSFSQHTQFILVTHNKRTMTYANRLYGVTMQEVGVSKVLSVKVDELNLISEYQPS